MKTVAIASFLLYFVWTFDIAMGNCPTIAVQALKKITVCIKGFGKITDFSKGSIAPETIEHYCATSAEREIQCTDELLEDCRRSNPLIRRALEKTVNVNGIRNSVKLICSNVDKINASQTCIGGVQDSVNTCIIDGLLAYDRKLKSLKVEGQIRGLTWLRTEVYKELCKYITTIADCQRPYRENCGSAIGDIFDAMVEGTRPPVCTTKEGTAATSSTIIPHVTKSATRKTMISPKRIIVQNRYSSRYKQRSSSSAGCESRVIALVVTLVLSAFLN